MSSTRRHTARKPVGSGAAFRPVPEYVPSAGQITSSPYVNAIPSAVADLSVDSRYDSGARRHSRESVSSDRFYDTEQQPEPEGVAAGSPAGVTTETSSPTIAHAPALFPHNMPAHLYHRYDGSRRDAHRGYQRLPSEGPEQVPSQAAKAAKTPPGPSPSSATAHAWSPSDSRASSTSSLSKPERHLPLRQHPAYQTYSTSGHASPATQPQSPEPEPEPATPLSMPEPAPPSAPAHGGPSASASGPSTPTTPRAPSPTPSTAPSHAPPSYTTMEMSPPPTSQPPSYTPTAHGASALSGALPPPQSVSAGRTPPGAPTPIAMPTPGSTSAPAPPRHASLHHPFAQSAPYGQSGQPGPSAAADPYQYPATTDAAAATYPRFNRPYLEDYDEPQEGTVDRSTWYAPASEPPQPPQLPPKPPKVPAPRKSNPYAVYGGPYGDDSLSQDEDAQASSERSLSPSMSLDTERDSSLSLVSETAVNPAGVPAAMSDPPGPLYRRGTSARPRHGTPLTLASLANRNSSSDLSPTASGNTPTSVVSYPPFAAAPGGGDSVSDHRSDAVSRASRASAASLGAASVGAASVGAASIGAASVGAASTDTASQTGPDGKPASKRKDESLGIGVGSAYVQRVRVDAAETHISKVPAVLPIGLRARTKSMATRVQPEFLRKAMDIRYTHLPQRMLETEVDDDNDVPLGQQQFPGTKAPPGIRPRVPTPPAEPESPNPLQRSHSPVESVMERPGKIKLFVANPDDESD